MTFLRDEESKGWGLWRVKRNGGRGGGVMVMVMVMVMNEGDG